MTGSLYFELNGVTYESSSSILITEVGEFSSSTGSFFPDSSLVCVTSEVNSQCCRGRDGGNVGEWYYPDGSMIPRRNDNPAMADFTRTAYREQVRLSRSYDALSPVGEYSCRVPREDGYNGEMHVGIISLGKSIQQPVDNHDRSSVQVWGNVIIEMCVSICSNFLS